MSQLHRGTQNPPVLLHDNNPRADAVIDPVLMFKRVLLCNEHSFYWLIRLWDQVQSGFAWSLLQFPSKHVHANLIVGSE